MQFSTTACPGPHSAVLLLWILCISGSRLVALILEPGTSIEITRAEVAGAVCTVCIGAGRNRQCSATLTMRAGQNSSVEFTCPQPQDFFTVVVSRQIDCSLGSCPRDFSQAEVMLFPAFNRTFTWMLKVSSPFSVQLNFSGNGVRQVLPTARCPDLHTLTVQVQQPGSLTSVGTFCRNGTVTTIQVLKEGIVTVEVQGGRRPDPTPFNISLVPEIKMMAVVRVSLAPGTSVAEFLSPNYPDGFPDDDLMMWDFAVPDGHNATVLFRNHTAPQCRKKKVAVEYRRDGTAYTISKELTDPQPADRRGDFNMSLRNCEVDRTARAVLSLGFQVSVVKSSPTVWCTTDLRSEMDLTLQIRKTDPGSACKMTANSVPQEQIVVSSGNVSTLTFEDCQDWVLKLVVSKTLGCWRWGDCLSERVSLAFPSLPSCLPSVWFEMIWTLRVPAQGTVELLPSAGGLGQQLHGQECGGSDFQLQVVDEGAEATVGNFCPGGAIRRAQIHANVSITALSGKDLRQVQGPVANVSFSKHIPERYIFMVEPGEGVPVFLATPGWPKGMKPFSTVSWVVLVPPDMQADLQLVSVSQPECSQSHASLTVDLHRTGKEILDIREDQLPQGMHTVPESFYLNVSNCQPENGQFSVKSKITLQRKPVEVSVLKIILGTLGGLLLLGVVVATIVCCKMRKKRSLRSPQISIYNPNGNVFLPHFSKTREDNESHVYASIEDTMVYGHLLPPPEQPPVDVYRTFTGPVAPPEVDVYRTFTGPMEGPTPAPPEDGVYRPFVHPSGEALPLVPSRNMVDNELYSFKKDGTTPPPPPSNRLDDERPRHPTAKLELESDGRALDN